jgi:hypothetical protein
MSAVAGVLTKLTHDLLNQLPFVLASPAAANQASILTEAERHGLLVACFMGWLHTGLAELHGAGGTSVEAPRIVEVCEVLCCC